MSPRALVWSDEFDGPSGSPPSAAWAAEVRAPADNDNDELQRYTASPANASLDGHGHLAITAASDGGDVSSARLVSKGRFEVLFGRVETRVRLPRGAGLWPAVWMLGNDIDAVGWPACGDLGGPVGPDTTLPHTLLVDYMRVYAPRCRSDR